MTEQAFEPKVKYIPDEAQPRSGGFLRGCMIFGCAMVFLCCFSTFGIFAGFAAIGATVEANEQTKTENETLEIETDDVNLVVENTVGDITIRGSRSIDEIEVELKMSATGLSKGRAKEKLDEIDYAVRRDGDRYIITVADNNNDGFNWGETFVYMTITVPEELNVHVTGDVGNIDLSDLIIRDEMSVAVDVGEVKFEGQIGPEGDHSITTNVGKIKVEVTKDSHFKLDARTDVGEIKADLNLRNEDETQDVVSNGLSGNYGDDDPEATLTLVTDVGEIEISD